MYRQRVGDYYVGRTIGEGSFAKVKYGQHVESGETVAIKVLDKEMVEKAKLAPQIKKEIAIMRRLRHPNVVNLQHVMATRSHIYLVLELVTGGELFERVAGGGPLQEGDARRFFLQLVDGLTHCHARGVFHRDLKLENILLTAGGDVKLSDFGLGAVREAAAQRDLLHTVCGTPNYAAPEVLQRSAYEGAPADIWSLGVCLYIMLAGCLPFDERVVGKLLGKICSAEYETPPWITTHAATLLRAMLTPNPAKRATLEEIWRHPWVTAGGLPPPLTRPSQTADADHPSNELTFSEAASLKTVREKVGSPRGEGRRKQLNAFELLGSALDISSLFEGKRADKPPLIRRATRFTSRASTREVVTAVERAAVALGGRCKRTDFEGVPSLWLHLAAGRGPLTLLLHVGEVVPELRLVEFHRVRGDSIDFFQFYSAILDEVSSIVARTASGQQPLSPSKVDALSAELAVSTLAHPSLPTSPTSPASPVSPASLQLPASPEAAAPESAPATNGRPPLPYLPNSPPGSPLSAAAAQPTPFSSGGAAAAVTSDPDDDFTATVEGYILDQPVQASTFADGKRPGRHSLEGRKLSDGRPGSGSGAGMPPPARSRQGSGDRPAPQEQKLLRAIATRRGSSDGSEEDSEEPHAGSMEWQSSRQVLARLSGQLSDAI